ncbi:hypothetical protein JZ751_014587 [Albula glossodonta]|uniref:Uncharacterized protein n=1 Tax=Albula glossodonta TaxID=121402 RepID=A0A8T2MVU8_9TELE|nr:hypothetical protein JZ751_014587 [Albula glossodonta]
MQSLQRSECCPRTVGGVNETCVEMDAFKQDDSSHKQSLSLPCCMMQSSKIQVCCFRVELNCEFPAAEDLRGTEK